MQIDISPELLIWASRSVFERAARLRSCPSFVWTVEYGRYSCGPPQASAPTGSERHWALSLQVGVPIRRLI